MEQREIKFRAWEKDGDNPQEKGLKGIMVCNEHLMENPKLLSKVINCRTDKYQLMQYTELKDENKKEYCEGDILENGAARWMVVFDTGAFCAECLYVFTVDDNFNVIGKKKPYKQTTHVALRALRGGKIIGNICQNPELK